MSTITKALQTTTAFTRKITFRHVLKSPYVVQWSQPLENLNETVLDVVRSMMQGMQCSPQDVEGPMEKYGSYFRVGLNNVTAALERKELAFVLITVPNYAARGMFEHLPPMCAMATVPLVTLSVTGTRLGKLFRLRSALAIGFTKDCLNDPIAAGYIRHLSDSTKNYSCVSSSWVPALPPSTPLSQDTNKSSLFSLAQLQTALNQAYTERVATGTVHATLKATSVHNGPVECPKYGAVGQNQRKRTRESEAAKVVAKRAKKAAKAEKALSNNGK